MSAIGAGERGMYRNETNLVKYNNTIRTTFY
jgi:hypothetical protein